MRKITLCPKAGKFLVNFESQAARGRIFLCEPLWLYAFLFPVIKPTKLRTIPALGHVAPAAAMILARVQEKPLASLRGAHVYMGKLIRGKQFGRGSRDRPQWIIKIARQGIEAPCKAGFLRSIFLRNRLL
jgi:hypothetical protein